MIPTLPEQDEHPSRRHELLARAKEVYRYDTEDHGLPYPAVVPPEDQYTLRALGRVAQLKVEGSINKLLAGTAIFSIEELRDLELRLADLYQGAVPPMLRAALQLQLRKMGLKLSNRWATPELARAGFVDVDGGDRWPLAIDDQHNLFVTLPEPHVARHYDSDWSFAYQRVAGTNPVEIRAFDPSKERERFPVTDAHLARALRFFERTPMTLAQASAEGRLFWVDYAILDGIPKGVWDKGTRRKYLSSPMALFVQAKDEGQGRPARLLPVAIQCEQKPDASLAPIFGPDDGLKWRMAKLAVQIADTHTHGIVQHLIYCHLYIGSAALAAFRNLAPQHPLRVLLDPHFEFTLITDDLTRRSTVSPGGVTETFQAVSFEGIYQLADRGRAVFGWDAQSPLARYEGRGVAKGSLLADYPFREDELRCFEAVHAFVSAYVDLYYVDDAQVVRDDELAAFVADMGSKEGGQVPGLAAVETKARLSRFVAELIARATSYHNGINYSVYPFMGFVANQPLAQYAPSPTAADASLEDYLKMMPPLSLTLGQMNDYWTVTNMLVNRFGAYPRNHFQDGRVAPLVRAFQESLRTVEDAIDADNRTRLFPYELLKPSRTAQSITV